MPTENYDLIGSYNNQRIKSIDSERSINLFEYIDPLAKKIKMLIPTSGLENTELSFNNTIGGFRASFFFNNNTYHVIGNKIWIVQKIGDNLVESLVNDSLPLTTSTGYVGIDANTYQIIFVDGLKGYIYDTNAQTFVQITDESFPTKPIDVCNLDGFFTVANGNTNQFQLCTFNQGLVWGPAANNFTTNFGVNSQLTIGASTISGTSGSQNYATGVPVNVTNSGGALPNPLVVGATYYCIYIDATHIELALSASDASAGIFIPLTNDGSGTQTITSQGQLQLGEITTHPGNIVACRTLHRRLFLFSSFYTEVWENAGEGTSLPFRRNNSLLMEYGTAAIGSISVGFDIMFFLSQTRDGLGSVMQVMGAQPFPVSTKALDFQLARYAAGNGVSDCRGFVMRENGLIFYRMNFTSSNHTFVYNLTQSDPSQEQTRFWHEEEVLNGDRHPAQTHVYYNGINYVGNYESPILYEVDTDIYTNDGENIKRTRIGRPFVPPGNQRMRIDRFQVDLLQGQLQALGLTPVAFLSVSKDGGQTYGNSLTAPMGEIGDRSFRTLWRKLGTTKRGQAFVPKLEFFQPIPFYVLGASWSFEVLPE